MKRHHGTIGLLCALSFFAISNAEANSKKYSDVQKFMRGVVAAHPGSAKLITIGNSDTQNLPIEGLQIGNGSVHNMVVATHHGNEYGSTEVAMAFAESIAANPINGQTVFVIPVLNISGFNSNSRNETLGGKTLDANRDYPNPCGTMGPFKLKSTAALAKFLEDQNIITSATLHTFSPAVTYPWGMSTKDLKTPYESIFKGLVQAAASESHYATGNTTDLIYSANGTFEDYAFLKHGSWSILFELGSSHSPSESDLETLRKVNVPGLRKLFETAPTTLADKHDFTGKCDDSVRKRDRLHLE